MARSFSIFQAGVSDLAEVKMLFRAYAATIGVDLSYQGFEQEVENLPGSYAPPAGALLIARAEDVDGFTPGEPLGCVAVRKLAEPATCEMKRLHTVPAARRAGVGSALAGAAIAAALQAGYGGMRLDTLPTMTAAQSLYRRLGFEITPAYYNSPIRGTIFMRKALRPPDI